MSTVRQRTHAAMAQLAPPGSRVLVACSGGADSQALLHVLAQLHDELRLGGLWAAGVDHGLRAEASDELQVAQDLATSLQVPFRRLQVTVDTRENTLAAARRVRLGALRELADELEADRIALGHTATDRAETILLFLARGASLRGASSMRRRRGRLIRPMLDIERDELRAYNREHGVGWVDDPSNGDPDRARTHIRERILPELTAINPQAVRHLGRFATWAAQDDRLLDERAQGVLATARGTAGSLDIAQMKSVPEPIARRVIHRWLREQALPSHSRLIGTILAGLQTGRLRTDAMRRPLRLENGRLWAYHRAHPWETVLELRGNAESRVRVPGMDCTLTTSVREPPPPAFDDRRTVAFDADRLHLPLRARAWLPGDRLQPFGHPGHVTIGNLFTNEKVPGALRAHWPLVLCGDEVVWVAGVRRSAAAPVTTESRRIVVISLQGALPKAAC